ncbi:dopamine beta-hydroxylase-like [Daktulosphaira vitifoliae]|uniref:dopamine beta-hydroxylase-like n=1 Tax=Daktulosphaira vitifoliae TaxID=58002 RepID=UPI0021AAAF9E|nr:dopamine beta-hydroxylase-like [Daktulosphaira vitifoliae]
MLKLVQAVLWLLGSGWCCIVALASNRVYTVPLDESGGMTLYWTLDPSDQSVMFEAHLNVSSPFDWWALGFSNRGNYTEADFCIMWVDWKGHTRMVDAWADDVGRLFIDEQQDCTNFDITRFHDGLIALTFSRKFDTCDDQNDYLIEGGTTHIVWMIGGGPLFAVNGLLVSQAKKKGMQRVQLLKPERPPVKLPNKVSKIDILANNVNVPAEETTYWCHVMKIPLDLSFKHHIVRFESVIEKKNRGVVHHIEVFHCEAGAGNNMPLYDGPCFNEKRPYKTQVCKKVIAAWAMGAPAFVYPEEAGLPIGGPDFNEFVMLEVHYNNPGLIKGIVDSSGIRLYITPNLRKYDAAVVELGLEYTDKMAIPPNQSDFTLSGYCISECTAESIPPSGIEVFGSQLHTHLTGTKIYTKHVRDGQELPELNRDNHYSTHFQEIRLLKRPVRVLPGDALITTCHFNTEFRQNITLGGFSITDEMCVNYVYYYPKTELEVCKSSISDQNLRTYFKFLKEWERQPTSTEQGISDNYKAVEWTPMRNQVLHKVYEDSTLSMQCNRSTGERFPGDWENRPTTKISYTLPPLARNCPN